VPSAVPLLSPYVGDLFNVDVYVIRLPVLRSIHDTPAFMQASRTAESFF